MRYIGLEKKDQQTNFQIRLKLTLPRKRKKRLHLAKEEIHLQDRGLLPGAVPQKRQKLISDEDSFSSGQEVKDPPSPEIELEREVSQQETSASHSHSQGTQTEFSKYLLSAKIDTMLLKNEVALMRGDPKTTPIVVSSTSFEAIANNSALMKHFVGLTAPQFEALYNFLNCICPLDSLTFWNCKEPTKAGNG